METLTRTRAVIFDFNGTLSDDEPVLARVFAEIFHAYLGWRMTSDDYFARLAGRSDREIVEIAVAERGGGLADNGPLVERLLASESPIRPGTEALVRTLTAAGHPLAVVTGAQRSDVDFVLGHSGIGGHFEVVVTEEDVTLGKPDPEGFLLAARRLGVLPQETVVFEDSLAGVRAARAAGMRCIAVTGTHDALTLAGEGIPTVDVLNPAVVGLL